MTDSSVIYPQPVHSQILWNFGGKSPPEDHDNLVEDNYLLTYLNSVHFKASAKARCARIYFSPLSRSQALSDGKNTQDTNMRSAKLYYYSAAHVNARALWTRARRNYMTPKARKSFVDIDTRFAKLYTSSAALVTVCNRWTRSLFPFFHALPIKKAPIASPFFTEDHVTRSAKLIFSATFDTGSMKLEPTLLDAQNLVKEAVPRTNLCLASRHESSVGHSLPTRKMSLLLHIFSRTKRETNWMPLTESSPVLHNVHFASSCKNQGVFAPNRCLGNLSTFLTCSPGCGNQYPQL